ncbi:glutaredoxin [Rickettsiales bacterium]|nr:glutaredoxin [Rickettsiales bacterium]
MSEKIFAAIDKYIKQHDIVLFMKGNALVPQCGFSNTVVNILRNLRVDFKDIDVLEDEDLRQAIKEYSNWPTIPQLYIKGEFIGGCDIVMEMYESEELESLLVKKGVLSTSES